MHKQHRRIGLFRFAPTANLGLGKGFQLSVRIPIDVRRIDASFTLPDGTAYEPPYRGPQHDPTTLFGIGDVELKGSLYGKPPGTKLLLGANLGLALPTGRTENDPFSVDGAIGPARFVQFGNGTFDPLVDLSFAVQARPVGFLLGGGARLPFYANPRGYQGPITVEGSVGATIRPPNDVLQLVALFHASHVEPERWHGELGENTGLDRLGASIGAAFFVRPKWTVQVRVRGNFLEEARGAQFSQPVVVTAGISGVIDLGKKN